MTQGTVTKPSPKILTLFMVGCGVQSAVAYTVGFLNSASKCGGTLDAATMQELATLLDYELQTTEAQK